MSPSLNELRSHWPRGTGVPHAAVIALTGPHIRACCKKNKTAWHTIAESQRLKTFFTRVPLARDTDFLM